MLVRELMTRDVRIAAPDQTIQDAAATMASIDTGFMPAGDNDQLVGTLTDRDIAVRAVAKDKGPETPVRDLMTTDVKYCFEDEEVATVADNMGDLQVRRLPVLDRQKRLVGVLSLGDIAVSDAADKAAEDALTGISRKPV